MSGKYRALFATHFEVPRVNKKRFLVAAVIYYQPWASVLCKGFSADGVFFRVAAVYFVLSIRYGHTKNKKEKVAGTFIVYFSIVFGRLFKSQA